MRSGKDKPPVAGTTEGQSKTVEAIDNRIIANRIPADKPADNQLGTSGQRHRLRGKATAFRASSGAIWRYTGKRARVLSMLATMPAGLTQWDCLPWHTRLGGTIHALRGDGLAIETEREGEYRHARYKLATPGCLIIQAENSEAAI